MFFVSRRRQSYDSWTVLRMYSEFPLKWVVLCQCGIEKVKAYNEVINGKSKQCRDCDFKSRKGKRLKFNDLEKYCAHCDSMLPLDEFHNSNSTVSKKSTYCKLCHTLYKYGLKKPDYEKILRQQDFKCALSGCDAYPTVIDHNHSCCAKVAGSCGKCVRGLLCSIHNGGIGMFSDKPDLLRAAANYLEQSSL